MTPPPTGTADVATLGPSGASAGDTDDVGEVASVVGDGEAGADVSAAGVGAGEPLDASAQAPSAAALAPARLRSPAARKMVRRVVAGIS
jgi:pyruvate/2-oxoglutarate dehydrogenase complex dihydrolipoamide acyltransferase (E2) component